MQSYHYAHSQRAPRVPSRHHINATTIMRLHNENLTKSTGEVIFNGKNLLDLSEDEMNEIRTKDIGMMRKRTSKRSLNMMENDSIEQEMYAQLMMKATSVTMEERIHR